MKRYPSLHSVDCSSDTIGMTLVHYHGYGIGLSISSNGQWMYKLVLSFLLLLWSLAALPQSTKGIWLTDVASQALDTKAGIQEVVKRCKAAGMGHIYVVTWNRGYTIYPSQVMEDYFQKKVAPRFSEFDVLAYLIEEAHQAGLQVHAWFEFGFSSSYQEADGGHILRTKPEWKALTREGELVSKNGFQWMNAFHPEVQSFLLALISEVVEQYDIDGVQGDDRLPANPSTAGYDPYTLALYQQEHGGQVPPADYQDEAWIDWRAGKLNLFAEKVYQTVKKIDAETAVTMAPSIFSWSKEEYLQDWPTWVKNGWVDQIIPQVYRYDLDAYTQALTSNLDYMPDSLKHLFVPGILLKVGDYSPSRRFLKRMIKTNRQLGLEGEVFFFYEGMKDHEVFFSKKYPKL